MPGEGIPWKSSGEDSALSLPRVQAQSLVGELRFHRPLSLAGKQKKKTVPCEYVSRSKNIIRAVELGLFFFGGGGA